MPPSLFRFVLKFSWRDQVALLCITALSLPFIYLSLDVPKLIINDVLGQGPLPGQVYGLPLEAERVTLLAILSGMFLLLVCINGGFKYVLNLYRGVVAERMLRRLRFSLFSNLMRFPLSRAQQLSPAETVPQITAETDPLGGYIGDALALPAFQGGLLATYTAFILVQDPVLGVMSLLTFPIQAYITPRMQKAVNRLAKQRVKATRRLAADIGDSISGAGDIHADANTLYHRSRIADKLGTLYGLRFEIYQRKFAIKFVNSFLNHVTPFFFYLFGGWLVLQGELTIGALVATLAAFREMASPWRELLKFYQQAQDAEVKYEQIVEQFEPDDLVPLPADSVVQSGVSAQDVMRVCQLGVQSDVGQGLAPIDLDISPHQAMAITDDDQHSADTLCLLLAQLTPPTSGTVTVGSEDWFSLDSSLSAKHIGYVNGEPWLFDMSLLENLQYGCFSEPAVPADDTARILARRSGNTPLRPDDIWVTESDGLHTRLHDALRLTGASDDLAEMGFNLPLQSNVSPHLSQGLLAARASISEQLQSRDLARHVHQYNTATFIDEFTLGENLLFAVADTERDWTDATSERLWIEVLTKCDLLDDLVQIGVRLNAELVEMFSDLPDNHRFFADMDLFDARDLPDMQRIARRIERDELNRIGSDDRWRLLSLVLAMCPAKHRIVDIDQSLQDRVVAAHTVCKPLVGQPGFSALAALDESACSYGLSVFHNALFGVLSGTDRRAHQAVRDVVMEQLRTAGLERDIIDHALQTQPGPGGRSLRPALRQRLGLSRALIKQPDWLIVNKALGALDEGSEALVIQNIQEQYKPVTLLWSPVHAANTSLFSSTLRLSGTGDHKVDSQGLAASTEEDASV